MIHLSFSSRFFFLLPLSVCLCLIFLNVSIFYIRRFIYYSDSSVLLFCFPAAFFFFLRVTGRDGADGRLLIVGGVRNSCEWQWRRQVGYGQSAPADGQNAPNDICARDSRHRHRHRHRHCRCRCRCRCPPPRPSPRPSARPSAPSIRPSVGNGAFTAGNRRHKPTLNFPICFVETNSWTLRLFFHELTLVCVFIC